MFADERHEPVQNEERKNQNSSYHGTACPGRGDAAVRRSCFLPGLTVESFFHEIVPFQEKALACVGFVELQAQGLDAILIPVVGLVKNKV